MAKLSRLGVAPPPPSPEHYLVAVEAGLYGDRIALQQWQHESRVASAIPDAPTRAATRPRRRELAPPPYTTPVGLPRALPSEHAADLYFGFSQPIGDGPLRHGLVPLSYLGPSGTSIPALSNKQCPVVSVVARLQTGNIALRRFPWRLRNPSRPSPHTGTGALGADDEFSDADTDSICASSVGPDDPCGPELVATDQIEPDTDHDDTDTDTSDPDATCTNNLNPERTQTPCPRANSRQHPF